MANMFSEVQQKEIPKNFKDCYANDKITDNLWQWAKNLEIIGKVFAIISGIATFITGIGMTAEAPDGPGIIITIIAPPIAAFLGYVSFHVLALLVGSLTSIVHNTRITANISLYKYATENNIPIENVETKNEEIEYEKIVECDKAIHEQYIKEMTDMYTDSKNAYWKENFLTAGRKLICRHCNKEIAYLSDINWGFSNKEHQKKCCPNCGKIQPASNKECYNCKTILED